MGPQGIACRSVTSTPTLQGPVTAAGGGPGAAQPEQRLPRPRRQRDTAPLPFCPSALPCSTEPSDPWCYFPRLLIPGAARPWRGGPILRPALSRLVYRPLVLRWRVSPASRETRRQPPCDIAADGLRKRRTSPSLQRDPMRSDQRKVFGSGRHPNHPQIIYTAGGVKRLVVRGMAA